MKNSNFCPGLKDNYTTKSTARNMRSVSNLYLQVRKRKVNFACRDNHTLVQFSWVVQLCLTLCNPMDCSMPGFPVHHQLPELTQTHVHWVGDAIQPSHPCHLLLPSNFPRFRVFSNESILHIRCPKYWSFRFSISPSSEYSGLVSFRLKCFDVLAVQEGEESRVFSNTPIQKHQFFDTKLSLWSNSHIHTWLLEKP